MDDKFYHGPAHGGPHFHSGPPGKRGLPGVSPKLEVGEVEDGNIPITVTDGYGQRTTDIPIDSVVTDERLTEKVDDWLDDHPEATTTVQDGSITVAKFHSSVVDSTLTQSGHPADAAAVGATAGGLDDRLQLLEDGAPEIISEATQDWLDDHVTPTGSAVIVDNSLTQSGAAADAKVTGDEISDLKSDLSGILIVGFDNNFDQSGYINNGIDAASSSYVRTSKYYNISDWAELIYIRHQSATPSNAVMVFYDENKTFLSNQGISSNREITKPSNAYYFRVYKEADASGLIYISDKAPSNPVDYSTSYIIKGTAFDSLLDAQPTGYNCFDNNFDQSGYINNGANASASGYVRTSKYYDCSSWDYVFVRHANSLQPSFTLVFYNENKEFISNQGASNGKDIKKPDGACYFRAYKNASSTGNTYISYALPDVEDVDYNYYEKQMVLSDLVPVTSFDFLNFKRRILNSNGKIVVNFGDSIYGNTQDDTSVSGLLSAMSGYDCVNAGFGGCQMSLHNITGWQPFSMCNLVNAIVTGDWSSQDASIAQASSLNLPYYFATTVATLKTIDFSNVYMVTIEYGTNDWSSGKPLDNESDPFDKGTYAGALRHSIKTLQTAYPKLKIVVQNPTVRINPTTGETSDTVTNSLGFTLVQYVEAENSACKQYKIPVINAYYESGFNVYNHDYYFASESDDVHLGYNGRYRLAEMVASFLLAHYRG